MRNAGLNYQMKSVLRDKFCLMTFLLPILAAVALNFMGPIDMSSLSELHFSVLEHNLSPQAVTWLERYGPVAEQAKVLTLERPDILESLQGIFIPAVLIVAMFIGCTFNAMNIISEKEDGVDYIKAIMLLFLAVPLVCALIGVSGPAAVAILFHLSPRLTALWPCPAKI